MRPFRRRLVYGEFKSHELGPPSKTDAARLTDTNAAGAATTIRHLGRIWLGMPRLYEPRKPGHKTFRVLAVSGSIFRYKEKQHHTGTVADFVHIVCSGPQRPMSTL